MMSRTRVYYDVCGPVGAPAVVFTHGVAMDHRAFNEQVSTLSDRYRGVIVWDMPGHGRSDPIDPRSGFSHSASRLTVHMLDEIGVDRAVLAGLSLGSLVSQYALANQPSRVAGLIHIRGECFTRPHRLGEPESKWQHP